MRYDDASSLDGRWLALANGIHDVGLVEFTVFELGPSASWQPGGLVGRIRREPPEVMVEETHWCLDERGARTMKADGWAEIEDIDLSDARLRSGGVVIGGLSVRWVSDDEVQAMSGTHL